MMANLKGIGTDILDVSNNEEGKDECKNDMEDNDEIDKYLSLPYTKTLTPTDAGTYFCTIEEIPECMAEGKTAEDALKRVDACLKWFVADAIKDKRPIPNPKVLLLEKCTGKFTIRIEPKNHYELALIAQRRRMSLNKLITLAICDFLQKSKGQGLNIVLRELI